MSSRDCGARRESLPLLPEHQEQDVIRVGAVLLSQLSNGHLRVVDNEALVAKPIDDLPHGVGALIQRGGRAVAGMLTIATAGGS